VKFQTATVQRDFDRSAVVTLRPFAEEMKAKQIIPVAVSLNSGKRLIIIRISMSNMEILEKKKLSNKKCVRHIGDGCHDQRIIGRIKIGRQYRKQTRTPIKRLLFVTSLEKS
jgi:hypothetical protein